MGGVEGRRDEPGQRLMILTAEAAGPSHDALRILTSWTTRQPSTDGSQ